MAHPDTDPSHGAQEQWTLAKEIHVDLARQCKLGEMYTKYPTIPPRIMTALMRISAEALGQMAELLASTSEALR